MIPPRKPTLPQIQKGSPWTRRTTWLPIDLFSLSSHFQPTSQVWRMLISKKVSSGRLCDDLPLSQRIKPYLSELMWPSKELSFVPKTLMEKKSKQVSPRTHSSANSRGHWIPLVKLFQIIHSESLLLAAVILDYMWVITAAWNHSLSQAPSTL